MLPQYIIKKTTPKLEVENCYEKDVGHNAYKTNILNK
jgi:hypothetical protein